MTPAHTPNARRILDVLASWHLEDDLIASDGGVARLAIVTLIAWIAAVAVPLATDHAKTTMFQIKSLSHVYTLGG
jgi:hypothetical protein